MSAYASRSLTVPVLLAVLLHLVIGLLFFLVRVSGQTETADYFEVALAQTPAEGDPWANDAAQARVDPRSMGSRSESSAPVNLPSRRMMLDEDRVTMPSDDDKFVDDSRGNTGNKISRSVQSVQEREFTRTGSTYTSGRRGVKEYHGPQNTDGSEFVYGSAEGTATDAYRLEWVTGGTRRLLSRVLPGYPEGLTRETPVRLRFTVRPDGRVENVVPLKKGDPRLEKISIRALSQWKFEPLAAGSDQAPQQGRITFIFKLK